MRRGFLIYVVLEELFKKFRACVLESALKFGRTWRSRGQQMGGNTVSHSRDVR